MNIPSSSRRALAGAAALSLALGLSACSALSSDSDSAAKATTSSGALKVSASFYPVQYLVQAVGGDHVSVTSVTPTNVEPHDFELSPKDVTALSETSLIAYVSGFQPSLDDAVSQVSGPTVLDLASNVALEHHDGVEEEHEEEATAEASTTASTAEASTSSSDAHNSEADESDPHFWLDPVRMKDAAVAVEAALAKADPANADDYEANLKTLEGTLGDLDASYEDGLAQCERKDVVTSHAAFGYLTERYGLTQTSISGVDPESEPSPADLAAVKKVVQSTGTTTIFTEELVSPKTAEAVASETGAKTAVLSPIESAPEEGDYATAMTGNLDELRTALDCK